MQAPSAARLRPQSMSWLAPRHAADVGGISTAPNHDALWHVGVHNTPLSFRLPLSTIHPFKSTSEDPERRKQLMKRRESEKQLLRMMCHWRSGGTGGGAAVVAGGRRRRYRAAACRQKRRQSAAEGAAVAGAAARAGRRRGGVLRVQVGICGMSPKASAAHPSFASIICTGRHFANACLCCCDLSVSVAAVLAAMCIFWPTLARRLPTAGLALGNMHMPSQHCALSCPGVPATACSGQDQSLFNFTWQVKEGTYSCRCIMQGAAGCGRGSASHAVPCTSRLPYAMPGPLAQGTQLLPSTSLSPRMWCLTCLPAFCYGPSRLSYAVISVMRSR